MTADAPRVVNDAVGICADAAGADELDRLSGWRLIDFRAAGFRRIRSFFNPCQTFLIAADSRTPQAAVFLVHGDRIAPERHAMILGRVDRLIRLRPTLRDF